MNDCSGRAFVDRQNAMSRQLRVGVIVSHPIQYHAPWFRELAKEIDLYVFFAHRPSAKEQGVGFGESFIWDVDLLGGYRQRFLENKAASPSVSHFLGCDTPEIAEIIRRPRNTNNRQRAKAFDAFIVGGWNLKCYWQAIRACRRAGVPVLVRGDSQCDPNQSWFVRTIKRFVYPAMLIQFNGFLSPGKRNREYLLHYGVPEGKIFFVPHFVDNERFAAQAEVLRPSRLALRKAWNIPEDALVALFCGKFVPKKRPMDLVKAAQLLLEHNPEFKLHLLFVGSGELGSELRANCNVVFDVDAPPPNNREQITDNSKPAASFPGFLNQTEVSQAYVAADVVVLASDYRETWGLVVNEALASDVPAIVSDAVGCASDLIVEGQGGFVFRLESATELAQKLLLFTNGVKDFAPDLRTVTRNYSLREATAATVLAVHSAATDSEN
jgi:glycosyltransferase involved in cell wall biosynthesis